MSTYQKALSEYNFHDALRFAFNRAKKEKRERKYWLQEVRFCLFNLGLSEEDYAYPIKIAENLGDFSLLEILIKSI